MSEINDEFEQKLQKYTQDLQNCQNEHQFNSCLGCEKVLECDTREDYVKAVYDSMSKGQGGGFEF